MIGFVVRNGFRLCSVWDFSVAFVAHGARNLKARRGKARVGFVIRRGMVLDFLWFGSGALVRGRLNLSGRSGFGRYSPKMQNHKPCFCTKPPRLWTGIADYNPGLTGQTRFRTTGTPPGCCPDYFEPPRCCPSITHATMPACQADYDGADCAWDSTESVSAHHRGEIQAGPCQAQRSRPRVLLEQPTKSAAVCEG